MQLSLFDNLVCDAVITKKHLYDDVYDWSYYCSVCGSFISHPRPRVLYCPCCAAEIIHIDAVFPK